MDSAELNAQIDQLVEEHRASCLWYFRADYKPQTDAQRIIVLDAIQKHAGREGYSRAGELKRWLSRLSSETSAESSPTSASAAERAT